MDERIAQFLRSNKVATICCVDEEGLPYCFSCFYTWDETSRQLYFKSSADTKHAQMMLEKGSVAGTVQPDKLNPLAIKGIQFMGKIEPVFHGDAAAAYHGRYPFALAMKGEVWTLQLQYIKMTDNTLGFGKKLVWEREVAVQESLSVPV